MAEQCSLDEAGNATEDRTVEETRVPARRRWWFRCAAAGRSVSGRAYRPASSSRLPSAQASAAWVDAGVAGEPLLVRGAEAADVLTVSRDSSQAFVGLRVVRGVAAHRVVQRVREAQRDRPCQHGTPATDAPISRGTCGEALQPSAAGELAAGCAERGGRAPLLVRGADQSAGPAARTLRLAMPCDRDVPEYRARRRRLPQPWCSQSGASARPKEALSRALGRPAGARRCCMGSASRVDQIEAAERDKPSYPGVGDS
jgi:hypothetical protein